MENSADFISIVVPTYNRSHWLEDAINSLAVQRTDRLFDFEILIINNNSTDDTDNIGRRLAQNRDVSIRYLFEARPGDAPARNCGIAQANGNWLAFFDDDQLAEPDWLLQLFQTAQEHSSAVVGGPVTLDLPPDRLEQLGPICRAALREVDFGSRSKPFPSGMLPGTCNALVSCEMFEKIGFFDENMTKGGSDTDFFMRTRREGFPPWYAPLAIVRHRIPAYRLTPAFFRWEAYSGAACHTAHFEYQAKGAAGLVYGCLGRSGKALVVHLPLLIWAWWQNDKGGVLGRKYRLWRVEGYTRKVLNVLFPRLFPQRRFFESLEFRKNRLISQSTTENA